jgi:two-component sensor histidine kinase
LKSKKTYQTIFFSAIGFFSIAGFGLVYLLFSLSSDVKKLSVSLIETRVEKTRTQLNTYFKPVEQKISFASNLQHIGLFNNLQKPETLNNIFFQYLKESSPVSSILIADSKLNEYLVLDLDTCFYNRITTEGSKNKKPLEYFWTHQEHSSELLFKKEKTDNYSSASRPWFQQALIADSIYWTSPYIFYTTKDLGITVSKKVIFEEQTHTIAFDLKINDISNYTTSIKNKHNEKVIVLTEDGSIIGLPAYGHLIDENNFKKHFLQPIASLGIDEINKAFSSGFNKQNTVVKIKSDNDTWFAHFEPYYLSGGKKLIIGVLVPESTIVTDLGWKKMFIVAGLVLVLVVLVFLLIAYNAEIKNNKLLAKKNSLVTDFNIKLNQTIQEKEMLVKEIHHRVKNNLQIVSGLLYLQASVSDNEQTKIALNNSISRISSMSLLHEKLYRTNDLNNISLQEYITDLCDAIVNSYDPNKTIKYSISVAQIPLDMDLLVSLGLIFNELITNSIKHAFNNSKTKEFSISSTFEDGFFVIKYKDNGKGIPEDFNLTKLNSLGMEIIKSLSKSVGAKVSFYNENGFCARFELKK